MNSYCKRNSKVSFIWNSYPMSTRNAKTYNKNADFVAKLGMPVVQLLAPQPWESILDLWCGDWVHMQAIASQWAKVVWIDPSESFIESVEEKWMIGYVADAKYLWFNSEFDAVFSNAAIHRMWDIDRVMKSVSQWLLSWGRFVWEFGGEWNVKTITDSIYKSLDTLWLDWKSIHSWYFPSVDEFTKVLQKYWFKVEYCERIVRPTPLPTWLHGWLEQFAFPFTKIMKETVKKEFIKNILSDVEPLLAKNQEWITLADYVRIRFKVIKK